VCAPERRAGRFRNATFMNLEDRNVAFLNHRQRPTQCAGRTAAEGAPAAVS
jgi:hypothetical protein